MGSLILALVLEKLREHNFTANEGFPGQKYPCISEPVAAVHIEKVDSAAMTVTTEVSIVCPASLGGVRCETEALRATQILSDAGGVCIQGGCRYDGIALVYVVSILATFACNTNSAHYVLGNGYRVLLDEVELAHVVSLQTEQVRDAEPLYEMAETAPVGIREGGWLWKLQLEELIPGGTEESGDTEGTFTLQLQSENMLETYHRCRWTSVRREFTRQGLRRIRTGISLFREEG